jgi:hypothetical protein
VQVPETSWTDQSGTIDTGWYNPNSIKFILRTNRQLAGLATIVNEGTDSFSGKTVTLDESVSLAAYAWTPIGTEDHPFEGTFDGGGNEVAWLLIDQKVSDGEQDESEETDVTQRVSNLGLFGCISNAEIRNLSVTNGYAAGLSNVGAVAGMASGSTFTDCVSSVELYAQRVTGEHNCSGLAGDSVGGIAGIAKNCEIKNCENTGFVSGNRKVGGIAGDFSGTMTDCVNQGECRTINEYCGGIIGKQEASMTISGCVNNGLVSGLVASGIVGNTTMASAMIHSCINNGVVDCGSGGGGIVNCIPERTSFLIEDCVNNGSICSSQKSGNGVGGIVGHARGGTVKNCTNNGDVTGGNAVTDNYGGIIGSILNYPVEITGCYNSGAVTASLSTARLGGIVGKMSAANVASLDYEANYQTKYEEMISKWSGNYYVAGTAPGALGSWDKQQNNEWVRSEPLDIAGKAEVDPQTVTEPPVTYGDVDGDGNINAVDSILISQYRAKLISLTSAQIKAADVDKNGIVNAADSILISRYRAKLISSF